ncbi:NAD(P)/FAD-dependent oxidoreductase [Algirhabdus cladophorae]|uniref:NAD(P)/FAD-dependent oxidoreductase n=1 Tax=Algirhabdus cladophorae TaxID=3377108 RepID=UPI003B848C93
MGTRTPAAERMSWLTANEAQGVYPDSWYRVGIAEVPSCPVLKGHETADLCIIGAGFTGLSAALHAAQAGMDVVVLEAHRVGWGASGRNGGQVGLGWNWSHDALAAKLGAATATALSRIADEALIQTKAKIRNVAPDANLTEGLIEAVFDERALKALDAKEPQGHRQRLDRAAMLQHTGSAAYCGGYLSQDAGFCNPFAYAQGLAKAALAAGVRIFEMSPAHRIGQGLAQTDKGRVTSQFLLHATNGYSTHLHRKTAARVLPINNYMAATEPLGDRAPMSRPVAVYDDKFVLNYFWQSPDGRLIYGGGESYGKRFPNDIAARVRNNLRQIYPQLADVAFTHAWGGTLAVTPTRLPYIANLGDGIFTAGGYSGHGVVLASHCGTLVVDAMRGITQDFDLVAQLPTPALPGGVRLGGIVSNVGMRWFALRDRLGL